jgi:hypothetical protein
MQPAVTSQAAPWVQQLASPQVAHAPAGKTPMQLPAPPVPLDVDVDVASLPLVEVAVVVDSPVPPVPVVVVVVPGVLLHAAAAMAPATRIKAYLVMGLPS